MMFRRILLLSLVAASLPACGEVKSQLGLSRRTPDEFAVVTRAPLEIPADLNAPLPPPQLGAPRPQETSPVDAAQTAILGQPVVPAGQQSKAENQLLQKAGVQQIAPNIRAVVNQEAIEGAEDNRPVVKKIMNIGNEKDEGPATILDAKGEHERLKTNKQTGQPVTQGDTPTIDD